MNNSKRPTYYELLEILPDAPQHEVVEAYRRAKETYSPNSPALYTMFSAEEASELLQLIEEAYLTLNNQSTRHKYDLTLGRAQIASSADQLPDFSAPELPLQTPMMAPLSNETNDVFTPAIAPKVAVQEIPSGFAKGKFGIYEIQEKLEAQIESLEQVDGEFLQTVRNYRGINLEQLSKETRISRSYIRAIEANDYDALPARVFLRGFIIQISKVIGLNSEAAANSYLNILASKAE